MAFIVIQWGKGQGFEKFFHCHPGGTGMGLETCDAIDTYTSTSYTMMCLQQFWEGPHMV